MPSKCLIAFYCLATEAVKGAAGKVTVADLQKFQETISDETEKKEQWGDNSRPLNQYLDNTLVYVIRSYGTGNAMHTLCQFFQVN